MQHQQPRKWANICLTLLFILQQTICFALLNFPILTGAFGALEMIVYDTALGDAGPDLAIATGRAGAMSGWGALIFSIQQCYLAYYHSHHTQQQTPPHRHTLSITQNGGEEEERGMRQMAASSGSASSAAQSLLRSDGRTMSVTVSSEEVSPPRSCAVSPVTALVEFLGFAAFALGDLGTFLTVKGWYAHLHGKDFKPRDEFNSWPNILSICAPLIMYLLERLLIWKLCQTCQCRTNEGNDNRGSDFSSLPDGLPTQYRWDQGASIHINRGAQQASDLSNEDDPRGSYVHQRSRASWLGVDNTSPAAASEAGQAAPAAEGVGSYTSSEANK